VFSCVFALRSLKKKMPSWITIIIGAAAAALPAFISALPADYGAAITAVVAAVTAIYHLYQPVPGTIFHPPGRTPLA
jgi:ABC-type cobalt transport system substrate-binding protein